MKRILFFSLCILLSNIMYSQTVIELTPDNDAYIYFKDMYYDRQITNYGTSNVLSLRHSEYHAEDIQKTLISFNEIDTNINKLISAELKLFYPAEYTGLDSGQNAFDVYKYNLVWHETIATWNNTSKPGASVSKISVPASDSTNQDYTIDVTSFIKEDYNSDVPVGFFLALSTEIDLAYQRVLFASKEHPDPALHPKLVLTYDVPENETFVQTSTSNENCSVSPASRRVIKDNDIHFCISTLLDDYIVSATYNGADVTNQLEEDTVTGNLIYATDAITADGTFDVSMIPGSYQVTTELNDDLLAEILSDADTLVKYDSSYTIIFQPDDNTNLVNVFRSDDDGEEVSILSDLTTEGKTYSYTINNISTEINIRIVLEKKSNIVNAVFNDEHCDVTPAETKVYVGDDQAFEIVLNPSYKVDSLMYIKNDILEQASYNNDTCNITLENVTTNDTLFVYTSVKVRKVTIVSEGNGTVSPSGEIWVDDTTELVLNIQPEKGHIIEQVSIDENIVPVSGNKLTLSSYNDEQTVTVKFAVFNGTVKIYPSDDAFVYYKEYYPERASTNYGSLNYLNILDSQWSSRDYNKVFIRFEYIQDYLDNLDIDTDIKSVKLKLFHDNLVETPHSGSNAFYVFWVDEQWDEKTIVWNNMVDNEFVEIVEVPKTSDSHQDFSIDVTEMFNTYYNTLSGDAGFLLELKSSESDKLQQVRFASKEHPNSESHPYILISYVDIIDDIDESLAEESTVKVLPNPTSGVTYFELPENESGANINIYSVTGNIVHTINNYKGSPVDLSGLPKGIYIANILLDNKNLTTRFVIK